MAEVMIQENLWRDLVAVAQKQRQEPQTLAQKVLRDYVQRVSDEELLERSARSARRAKFRMADAEEIVRRYRSRKA